MKLVENEGRDHRIDPDDPVEVIRKGLRGLFEDWREDGLVTEQDVAEIDQLDGKTLLRIAQEMRNHFEYNGLDARPPVPRRRR